MAKLCEPGIRLRLIQVHVLSIAHLSSVSLLERRQKWQHPQRQAESQV